MHQWRLQSGGCPVGPAERAHPIFWPSRPCVASGETTNLLMPVRKALLRRRSADFRTDPDSGQCGRPWPTFCGETPAVGRPSPTTSRTGAPKGGGRPGGRGKGAAGRKAKELQDYLTCFTRFTVGQHARLGGCGVRFPRRADPSQVCAAAAAPKGRLGERGAMVEDLAAAYR